MIDSCEHMVCGVCESCSVSRAAEPEYKVVKRPSCALCGKTASEVKHLIAGALSDVSVCDECIFQAVKLLVSVGWTPPNLKIKISVNE